MKKTLRRATAIWLTLFITINMVLWVFAEPTGEELLNENRSLHIESNDIYGWPKGPVVGARSACLMDANSGTILYAKNMDTPMFPASTTKVMTCLLAVENCQLDEIVTFSNEAVYGIERDSSNVGIDVGQEMTMEECLYCIMLASANEVASAVAEHVGGSIEGFADMMNKRAAELGCTNTHFMNANGLHNDDHYTSAHDLALITAEFFKNETLRNIASTSYYTIYPSAKQPDEFGLTNHHKMLLGRSHAYEYIVGGKTGYTTVAHQTLASCAEKDGMLLVCTVMRDERPYQYEDTAALFDYGFENFKNVNIADNESNYSLDTSTFFDTDIDIFGSSKDLFTIDRSDVITIPNDVNFDELTSKLTYDESGDNNILATITYYLGETSVGSGSILVNNSEVKEFEFGKKPVKERVTLDEEIEKSGKSIVFVDIKKVLIIIGIVIGACLLIFILQAIARNYSFASRRRRKIIKKHKRYRSEFDDFDF